jgi:hypothetical protein
VTTESHQGAIHIQVTTTGLNIAKDLFQVHGMDASEKVLIRKQLRRTQLLEFGATSMQVAFATLDPSLKLKNDERARCQNRKTFGLGAMAIGSQARLGPSTIFLRSLRRMHS